MGNLIFKEKEGKKQSAVSLRPFFIANCDEHVSNILIIGETFENEIMECTENEMDLEFNDQKFAIQLRMFPMMDSKLIDLGTGLGGAFCSCCTASEEEALMLSNIRNGRKNTLKHYQSFDSFFI